jgi:hypothetical protein
LADSAIENDVASSAGGAAFFADLSDEADAQTGSVGLVEPFGNGGIKINGAKNEKSKSRREGLT